MTAAPVDLCKAVLKANPEKIGGIVINSGNANACTGKNGMADAQEMSASAQVTTNIGLPFYVCSTGRIGRRLPIDKISAGLALAQKRSNIAQHNPFRRSSDIDLRYLRKLATVTIQYQAKLSPLQEWPKELA